MTEPDRKRGAKLATSEADAPAADDESLERLAPQPGEPLVSTGVREAHRALMGCVEELVRRSQEAESLAERVPEGGLQANLRRIGLVSRRVLAELRSREAVAGDDTAASVSAVRRPRLSLPRSEAVRLTLEQPFAELGSPFSQAPPEGPPGSEPEARGTLLLVDDSALGREVLASELRDRGYLVETADGGRAALAMIEQYDFDLVLLDVMMPDLSGTEVLEAVRRRYGRDELPVVMATAREGSEDVVAALQLGANDYVPKSHDFAVILARIETQLELKRTSDDLRALNRRLEDAHKSIGELVASGSQAFSDVEAWASSVASEVARGIAADAVEIWIKEGAEAGSLRPLGEATRGSALLEDLKAVTRTGRERTRGPETIMPVLGPRDERLGAVVVSGERTDWGAAARRLVESFTRQLGTALETQRLRRQLERAAAERHARGQQMLDQGIDLLRLCPECGRCFDQRAERCDTDGAVLEAPRAFPYRLSGRYRLLQVRGEGGMATVYRAHDERLNRTVAVKVIKPELFQDPAVRERFAHEARVLASIEHPGVVAVFDSGELDDESQFMVMEWLAGCDLGDLLKRRGAGSPPEVAQLVRQAGAALGAAHAAGLIHRDIKPDNLLLVPAPAGFWVKLVDFGVAKEVGAAPELTSAGALVGTPLYMSPEQFMGAKLDTRTDVYSIATVVFEALTGRRVTLSREFADIVIDVMQGTPPPVTSFLPDAPVAVDELLAAALSKSPKARPADVVGWAGELARELESMPATPRRWIGVDGRLCLDARDKELHKSDPEGVTVLSGQKS